MPTARSRILSTYALAFALSGCPPTDEAMAPSDDASAHDADAGSAAMRDDEADAPRVFADADVGTDAAQERADALSDAPAGDAVERLITLVLAAPDLPPQYVCLGSFARDAEGEPVGDPVLAGGPFGIPDSSDASGKALRSGFPYGTVVKLPLFVHDRMYFDGLLPIGFVVDEVDVHETVRGGDSPSCKRAWANARAVPGRQVRLTPVTVGQSFVSGVTGCRDAAPGCAPLATSLAPLDLAPLSSGQDDAGLALQVVNLAAASSLQSIDAAWQPRRAIDGGVRDDGEPQPLGTAGLERGQVSVPAAIRVADFEPTLSVLLLKPHGAAPCVTGDECATVALPIEPFRDAYAAKSGGATGAAWDGHQVLVVFGGAASGTGPATPGALRLAMFRSTFAPGAR